MKKLDQSQKLTLNSDAYFFISDPSINSIILQPFCCALSYNA